MEVGRHFHREMLKGFQEIGKLGVDCDGDDDHDDGDDDDDDDDGYDGDDGVEG